MFFNGKVDDLKVYIALHSLKLPKLKRFHSPEGTENIVFSPGRRVKNAVIGQLVQPICRLWNKSNSVSWAMQSKIVAVKLWFASFLLVLDLNWVILSTINLFHSWPTGITYSDFIFFSIDFCKSSLFLLLTLDCSCWRVSWRLSLQSLLVTVNFMLNLLSDTTLERKKFKNSHP